MAASLRVIAAPEPLRTAGLEAQPNADDYFRRLTKLVPAEILGLYVTGAGVIPAENRTALIGWAVFCLAGLIGVRRRQTSDPAARLGPQWMAVGISAVSFAVWLYALGGPFAALGIRIPYLASLLVFGWTFVVPLFYRGDPV